MKMGMEHQTLIQPASMVRYGLLETAQTLSLEMRLSGLMGMEMVTATTPNLLLKETHAVLHTERPIKTDLAVLIQTVMVILMEMEPGPLHKEQMHFQANQANGWTKTVMDTETMPQATIQTTVLLPSEHQLNLEI
jgi:hypothetical protein